LPHLGPSAGGVDIYPKETRVQITVNDYNRSMESRIMQSVLVTGANGFIGRHLVRRLVERGCRVTCLVRDASRIDPQRPVGAGWVTGDITDRAGMERAIATSGADTVFHLAGLVRALRTEDFLRANADGAESVAAACASQNNPPRLVMVSSLAAAGPCKGDLPRTEEDLPSPVSAYGRSKLAGEQAIAKYAEKVSICIVRPPIVFGPGDRAVFEMFEPIARWGIHVVPGRGLQRFSLIYVADLVEGLLLAAEKGQRLQPNSPSGQGIYFISGDDPVYAQLGQGIAASLGKKRAAIVPIPSVLLQVVGLFNDVIAKIRQRPCRLSSDKVTEALAGSWMCSSAKARTELGWSPAATLAQRLNESAKWYIQEGWL
jgi:nucleoside-diphosphate-sugar epimerase